MPAMNSLQQRTVERLVEVGILTAAQAKDLLERQRQEGTNLLTLLQQCAVVTDDDFIVAMGNVFDVRPVRIDRCRIPDTVLALVPIELCRKHQLIPVSRL